MRGYFFCKVQKYSYHNEELKDMPKDKIVDKYITNVYE